MPDRLTILITGAGAPGTRGTLWALRAHGPARPPRIVGVDLNGAVAGRYLCDAFHTVPPPEAPGYLERLLEIAAREGAQVVLPQTTREVAAIAAARESLAARGLRAAVADGEAIRRANNKHCVLEAFGRLGLPAPAYRWAPTERELRRAARELGYPERPVVVKPPVSNGMRGFRVVTARAWDAARFFAEKPSGIEITLAGLCAILRSAPAWPGLLVTEYLPGPEYSVDAFLGARCRLALPRLRQQIRSGISFVTRAERRADLIEYTLRAAEHLGLTLAFGFQYKLDAAGVPKVLECNPRVQGTMAASVFAGANPIWMAVAETLGQPPEEAPAPREAAFYRFWGGLGVCQGRAIEI